MKCNFICLNWVLFIKKYLKKDFFTKKNLIEKPFNNLYLSELALFKPKNPNFSKKLNLYKYNERLIIDFFLKKAIFKAFLKKKYKKPSFFHTFNPTYSGNTNRSLLTSTKSHYKNFYPLSSLHVTKGDIKYLLGKEKRKEIDNSLRKEIIKLMPLKSIQIKNQSNLKKNLEKEKISHTDTNEIGRSSLDKFFNKKLLIDINRALQILDDLFT